MPHSSCLNLAGILNMNDRSGKLVVAVIAATLLITTLFFRQASSQNNDAVGGGKPDKQTVSVGDDDPTYGLAAGIFFVTLNAPASPAMRGQPDSTKKLGASVPAVWETFKNSTELYRPQGAVPPDWNTVCELPDGFPVQTVAQLQQQFGPTNSTWIHYLSESRMIDGQQVVDTNGAVIRYEVRCNQDHFNYVANNPSKYQLFNVEGQKQALGDTNFTFNFPPQCIEVKASWRILKTTDDDSRYWTAYGAYFDDNGQPAYAKIGLTAFHFITHTEPNWLWFTYEQIDNPTTTFKYFLQEKQEPVGPNNTANSNAPKFNAILGGQTTGTKWQYYQIIGWQGAETGANGKPVILANSNIETYFPATSSCMSCHAMANIGETNDQRLNFWLSDRKGIRGRVGDVDFDAIATKLAPGQKFKQMNYVWSLRQAQSTQAPDAKPAAKP